MGLLQNAGGQDMKYVWKKNIRTKIDHLLLNPLTGFPIMFLCFTLLFAASFVLGKPLSNYLGLLLDSLAMAFEGSSLAHIMPSLLTSLIANGVFRGIGSALAAARRLAA
jgi:Fe2+ transport system protein B